MQTIAICDMRGEDTEAQMMFWEKMNDVMLRCGHALADFVVLWQTKQMPIGKL